jgi:hypothetical protein
MRDYYDFLQSLRDREDELVRRDEKMKQEKLKTAAHVLGAFARASKALPRNVLAAVWRGSFGKNPEWKPITNFLFPDSK